MSPDGAEGFLSERMERDGVPYTEAHVAYWRDKANAMLATNRRQADHITKLEAALKAADAEWDVLAKRLIAADDKIRALVGAARESDRDRLAGKRSGVLLALDYLRGYRR